MKSKIETYRDLQAWRIAKSLGLKIYEVTKHFPVEERYGLTSQLRRGAVAVASDIAEGYGRGSRSDYVRFLRIARGALYEVDTQLRFATELGYLSQDSSATLFDLWGDCERVLAALIRSLERAN